MEDQKIRAIIAGATGMVGEGVLTECLSSDRIEKILLVSRKSYGHGSARLSEILLPDFFDLSPLAGKLGDYQACFFCLGVSSVGMKKEQYEKLTYDLTIGFARALVAQNPQMVFCYVSGAHTDSTEKGNVHWARVKGKTENELLRLGFRNVYLFRPGIMKPTPGSKNTLGFYKWMGWLIPVIEKFSPDSVCSLAQLGQAMIRVAAHGFEKNILEVRDIKKAAGR